MNRKAWAKIFSWDLVNTAEILVQYHHQMKYVRGIHVYGSFESIQEIDWRNHIFNSYKIRVQKVRSRGKINWTKYLFGKKNTLEWYWLIRNLLQKIKNLSYKYLAGVKASVMLHFTGRKQNIILDRNHCFIG